MYIINNKALPPHLAGIPLGAEGKSMASLAKWTDFVETEFDNVMFAYLRERNSYLQQVRFYRRVDPCVRNQIATPAMERWAALSETKLNLEIGVMYRLSSVPRNSSFLME